MAQITAKMVAELRAKTGAGMMDCKKALEEANGDFEKATDLLREKGLATAAKKAGRTAAEGRVYATVREDGRLGAMVEVNCETDFVGRGETFIDLCRRVTDVVLEKNPADMNALNQLVGDTVREAIVRTGENMTVRRFVRYQVEGNGLVHAYIHGEGRVGVLVELEAGTAEAASSEEVRNLAHELALQIASMRARYVRREDVPADVVEHEKEILKAQAVNEGKKPEIAEKMVQGRLQKFYKEVCLLDQEWVKDSSKNIAALVKETAGKVGTAITVKRFTCWEKGEGIEERSEE